MYPIEELASQIVNSDDVTAEFAKIASNMDERWKVTLAREVNKQNFIKKLQESDLNSDIKFNVVETPEMSKIASEKEKNKPQNLTKTASINKQASMEKKAQILPSMFVIKQNETLYREKISSGYTHKEILTKEAKEAINDELAYELKDKIAKEENEKNRLLFETEMAKETLLDKIASLTDMESEMRSIIKTLVKSNMEKYAEDILMRSNVRTDMLSKVASENLDIEKEAKLDDAINKLAQIDELIEKKAFGPLARIVTTVLGRGLNLVGTGVAYGAKGAATATKGLARTAIKHPIATTAIVAGSNTSDKSTNQIRNVVLGY